MSYRVYLDANYHQMDTSARTMSGEFSSHAQAVAAARELIDGILDSEYHPSMSAEELLHAYVTRAEEPFIIPDDGATAFDGRDYASARCRALCRPQR